jgi:hypothetical protein
MVGSAHPTATAECYVFAVNYQLSTINYQLSTINYQLSTGYIP